MLNRIIYKNVQKIKLSTVIITLLDFSVIFKSAPCHKPRFKQLLGRKIGWRLCSIFQHWYGMSDPIFHLSPYIVCLKRQPMSERQKSSEQHSSVIYFAMYRWKWDWYPSSMNLKKAPITWAISKKVKWQRSVCLQEWATAGKWRGRCLGKWRTQWLGPSSWESWKSHPGYSRL
jgi:hypothetical protein